MIALIASSINFIILLAAIFACALAVYLWRRSRDIPREMRETMLTTARTWGLNAETISTGDLKLILEALRVFVETADTERRAELRGFIKGGDRKPDLDLSRLRVARTLARVTTEVFPLLGILGTVCALSVSVGMSKEAGIATSETLKSVISLFGTAISSTIYGLSCAVIAMYVFGTIESKLEESLEIVRRYRDIIDKAVLIASSGER